MRDANFLVPYLIVIFTAIGFHEYAHCKVADLSGDPTPRSLGRVTLNLFKHFDALGSIMILVTTFSGFGIGWGKPSPANPSLMRNPRWDWFMTVAAGPLSNILQASIWAIVFRVILLVDPSAFKDSPFFLWLFILGVFVNVMLALFNLLPLGPLDGHWLVGLLMPDGPRKKWFMFNARYGFMILIGLVIFDQTMSERMGFSIFGTLIWPGAQLIGSFMLGQKIGF